MPITPIVPLIRGHLWSFQSGLLDHLGSVRGSLIIWILRFFQAVVSFLRTTIDVEYLKEKEKHIIYRQIKIEPHCEKICLWCKPTSVAIYRPVRLINMTRVSYHWKTWGPKPMQTAKALISQRRYACYSEPFAGCLCYKIVFFFFLAS